MTLVPVETILNEWILAEWEFVESVKEYRNARSLYEKKMAHYNHTDNMPATKAKSKMLVDHVELYDNLQEAKNIKDRKESKRDLMKAVYYDSKRELQEGKMIDIEASLLWKQQ